ncbi:MAG: sigma-70 family RNA polymerase sigma factor [Pelagibacteraceae bacterium]|jgi:RNA polymerase sigma-70 factor (ECF subfamily)|nr:sigma-70 family RNA polymerase sigma factor [Pelagibacteraceae bacterium]MBT3902461.1 sigma-70 family RNA polymerase sigma factor [Pelagibacteraceae bacterium]MBT4645269.1 sigma-70 family RNA polymerase sigma factor [Pelagibacteraceae bacterium]MBT6354837.1 sigma-70 family RNA polymerase sigma factor [Pelagibacteraceae bacterium]
MENTKIIDLVKKISEERDEEAFSQIFDYIAPKINSYFIKNNFNFEQSEELTQDVLSTIWSKANLFNPEKSKFITWSFTIARNKKIDFYRKTKKNDVNEDDIRSFLYPNDDGNDYEIESTINKIKEELDQNQQKLIKMSFFEQKSHKNIAEELEIPLGTVKSRIRTTLNKMQKLLS